VGKRTKDHLESKTEEPSITSTKSNHVNREKAGGPAGRGHTVPGQDQGGAETSEAHQNTWGTLCKSTKIK